MLPLLLVCARLYYIWWQQCEKDSFSASSRVRRAVTTSRNPSYDLTLNSTDSTTRETLLRQQFIEGLFQHYKQVIDTVVSASSFQAVQLANAVRQRSVSTSLNVMATTRKARRTSTREVAVVLGMTKTFRVQQRAFSGSCFGCGSERTPKKRMFEKRPRAAQHNPGTVHEDGRVEPTLGRHCVQAYDVSVANSHK